MPRNAESKSAAAPPAPSKGEGLARRRVAGPVRDLAIVLGDQLDIDAPLIRELDPVRDAVLMMEVAEESTRVWSSKQRTTVFLAAMRHFAMDLQSRGVRVHYITLDDADNQQSFGREIRRAVDLLRPARLRCTWPGEWGVLAQLQNAARLANVPLELLEDTHFLTTRDEFSGWAAGRRQLVMEYFYREQRRKLGILVDAKGGPVGGKWNYDADNRAAFKTAPKPPLPPTHEPDEITREVMALVERRFPEAPGTLTHFRWPLTRAAALRELDDFIDNRLPRFGDHQDAMWEREPFLYHSLLSTPLNLKLLNPREVVGKALRAYEAGRVPLNCVEGFVRQVIGWREFIRGVYWHIGPDYANRNALDQHGRLPEFYWTADTDMNCMRHCLSEVRDNGFGHHIQRLMVTGNFALISGVSPRAISDWYLAMYADAVDWVTLPNTLGMAMHADGGVVGTKPYAASGKYIDRMSNYCSGCKYDVAARTGPQACPFNVFYWDFLIRNRERLRSNQRMSMILKNVDRLAEAERSTIAHDAERLRKRFQISGEE
ncbi:MAG: cryptochrome/photolyase family protein [Phycisphaerae bacterium]|nr:cryptochrome/photolyase family protein [Phycisphaerae bacterium]